MSDVGCHLRNHRYLHATLHTFRIGSYQFRTLAHIAAHAFILHLRTREVQLHRIAACLLGHPGQGHPFLFALSHNAGHHHFGGIVLLQTVQNVEIHLYRILAQLFHVAEAVEVAVRGVVVHGIESGRHLLDFLHADGLIEHACPTSFKGTGHHVIIGADGG